tara:strand:+ start:1424 stop:1654 length:231 start_codon:yes stop_codon:yes gene_type:complete
MNDSFIYRLIDPIEKQTDNSFLIKFKCDLDSLYWVSKKYCKVEYKFNPYIGYKIATGIKIQKCFFNKLKPSFKKKL